MITTEFADHRLMKNYYKRTQFLTSASQPGQFPEQQSMEIAFAGRSNAGKSSALNTLCQNKTLARTSKTPGRTQLINFFTLDDTRRLVDLPGYGYAKVPEKVRKEWQKLMENYLSSRDMLCGLVIIMDIRHPLKDYDLQMIDWCHHYQTPVHVLLTKADKLKRGPAMQSLNTVRNDIKKQGFDVTVQMFSSLNKSGLNDLQDVLNQWLNLTEEE